MRNFIESYDSYHKLCRVLDSKIIIIFFYFYFFLGTLFLRKLVLVFNIDYYSMVVSSMALLMENFAQQLLSSLFLPIVKNLNILSIFKHLLMKDLEKY